MLEIRSHSEESGSRMPMDYSQYLLSASPPSSAFDLLSFSSQHAFNQMRHQMPFDTPNTNYTAPASFQCLQMAQSGKKDSLKDRRKPPLKPIIVKPDYSYSSDSEGDSGCETPTSPRRSGKKVSFADHKGLALAHVRLVKESPDEPPQLNLDLISSLTLGTDAKVSVQPPINICFPQPASDYMAFRDKLNRSMISLENVIIRDYTVEGTIKVKNISFEKRVFVRLSLDEWISFEDIEAKYVPGPGISNNFSDPYDTFSFTLDISPNFDVSKRIQFAVCFEENDNAHWDNRDGANYVIVSENFEEGKNAPHCYDRFLPVKKTEESWTEFSVWKESSPVPYY